LVGASVVLQKNIKIDDHIFNSWKNVSSKSVVRPHTFLNAYKFIPDCGENKVLNAQNSDESHKILY
jgi:hypothetical protein